MNNLVLSVSASLLILSIGGCALVPGQPPASTPTPMPPPSGYDPQPGDENLKRDKVFLEAENSSVIVAESYPVQVSVLLDGNLSDPCHQLRVKVQPPNTQKEIKLDVYSVFDPAVMCVMVLKPFHATIPLGSFPPGHYTVLVNDQVIGEFDT